MDEFPDDEGMDAFIRGLPHFSEGKQTMKLKIREMIAGGPSRLRFVFRYSTSRVYHRESVAEHSYYTALYALFVARWVDENNPDKNWHEPNDPEGKYTPREICLANLLQRALLHDLEEARSGDFPRSFKHSDPDLKAMLEKASEQAFRQILKPLIEEDKADEDGLGDVASEYLVSWIDSKDNTPEGAILEFADFLSVLGFLLQEGAGAGNKAILEHVEDMEKYFSKFNGEKFKFLNPLISQTRDIMQELFHNDNVKVRRHPGSPYDAGVGRLPCPGTDNPG